MSCKKSLISLHSFTIERETLRFVVRLRKWGDILHKLCKDTIKGEKENVEAWHEPCWKSISKRADSPFYGPAGCKKTSRVLVVMLELLSAGTYL